MTCGNQQKIRVLCEDKRKIVRGKTTFRANISLVRAKMAKVYGFDNRTNSKPTHLNYFSNNTQRISVIIIALVCVCGVSRISANSMNNLKSGKYFRGLDVDHRWN